jgi:hypothetical protein
MKIQEIASFEQTNRTTILLVREGLFWRAYGRSAQLFCAHIRAFQVKRRTVKATETVLVYIGFPHMILADILAQAVRKGAIERSLSGVEGPLNDIHLEGFSECGDFASWFASLPPEEPKSPAKEKSQATGPAFAYKQAYDLLLEVFRRSQDFSKSTRYTLGERLRGEALDLLTTVYLAAQGVPDLAAPQKAIHAAGVIRLYLRILNDLHEISFPVFTSLNESIQELYRQLEHWNTGMAGVPACQGIGE